MLLPLQNGKIYSSAVITKMVLIPHSFKILHRKVFVIQLFTQQDAKCCWNSALICEKDTPQDLLRSWGDLRRVFIQSSATSIAMIQNYHHRLAVAFVSLLIFSLFISWWTRLHYSSTLNFLRSTKSSNHSHGFTVILLHPSILSIEIFKFLRWDILH